jgi:hypothetical protein
MKKLMLALAVVAAVGLFLGNTAELSARPQYKMAWDKTYMVEGSAMAKALDGKSTCNVCHVGAKSKKNRNDYGMALAKTLGEPNVKDAEAIAAAFKKVGESKSKGEDSPTFGKLIEEGKLPMTPNEPAQ